MTGTQRDFIEDAFVVAGQAYPSAFAAAPAAGAVGLCQAERAEGRVPPAGTRLSSARPAIAVSCVPFCSGEGKRRHPLARLIGGRYVAVIGRKAGCQARDVMPCTGGAGFALARIRSCRR